MYITFIVKHERNFYFLKCFNVFQINYFQMTLMTYFEYTTNRCDIQLFSLFQSLRKKTVF